MKLVMFLFLIGVFPKSFGQQNAREITERFFSIYKTSPDSAIDYYFSKNKWVDQEGKSKLKAQLFDLTKMLGEFNGVELIAEKSAGNSLKLFSYLVKYERQPIRLIFYLYKPADTWRPQTISYDLNIREDLEEAAKAYRFPENLQ